MKLYLLPVFILLSCMSVFAQNIQKTLDNMALYTANNSQEKLYLHLDKNSYMAGETIWFKAYATVGLQNLMSNQSGIAYIELIDGNKKTVNTLTIPLVMGLGMGDIKLNDTITEGSYRLRAYTNWMRNAGEAYFYDRTIAVANGRSDNVKTLTTVSSNEKDNIYTIGLANLLGEPIAKKQVRYEVVASDKTVDRKRASTDEKGFLSIPVNKKYGETAIKMRFNNTDELSVNKIFKALPPDLKNDVQVFPEGGKVLGNRLNNIAVKVISPQGLGVKAKVIFVSGTDTVGLVETNKLGMGNAFVFFQSGRNYSAVAVFEDGSSQDVVVPVAQSSGYSTVVNTQNENKVYAQLNVSEDLISQMEVYFVVHHSGETIYVSKQKLSKDELVFSVDRGLLPSGVITITFLNDQFIPIVERPFFNLNSNDLLPISIRLNKSSFFTRDKVKVDLQTGLPDDTLKFAALSAAVLDMNQIKDSLMLVPNILSSLLLSADLKGYIETPGYYFEEGQVNGREVDLLLLTQGWRNIDWKGIREHSKPVYSVEKALKISGYTKKLGRAKPESEAKVQLISTKNFMDYMDTVSNADGYFSFDNLLFPDSIKFLITAKDSRKGKNNIDIVLDSPENPAVERNKNAGDERWDINSFYTDQINVSKQYFAELEGRGLMDKAIAIEEVVVRASTRKKVSDYSSNLNGPGNADEVLTTDDLGNCPTLVMCLNGRLMGVMFMSGAPYNTRGNVPMQVVLDGMYIESDQLSMINVNDVESVEVLRNVNYTAIYGSQGAGGLLIITSKRGLSAMNNYTPKGILTVQPQGLHVNKQFYKPTYDVAEGVKLRKDLRATIHWEPNIVADKTGRASFDFFTSDAKGYYLMVIEGLDYSGKILRKVVQLEVK